MTPLSPVIISLTKEIDDHVPGALRRMTNYIDHKIINEVCVNCDQLTDPTTYKNKVDAMEYQISGICEKCQPDFFGPTTTPKKRKGRI